MIRGLCRMHDPWLGTGVRVHDAAGDASPFLPLEIYEMLQGQPAFEALPPQCDYERLEMHARESLWRW